MCVLFCALVDSVVYFTRWHSSSCFEKWDQTGSPEIPVREETSEIPSLPAGERKTKYINIEMKFKTQWRFDYHCAKVKIVTETKQMFKFL